TGGRKMHQVGPDQGARCLRTPEGGPSPRNGVGSHAGRCASHCEQYRGGAATPLAQTTGARISRWKEQRGSEQCPRTRRVYSAASVNRPRARLRHLLRLAMEEWEVVEAVPRIGLE